MSKCWKILNIRKPSYPHRHAATGGSLKGKEAAGHLCGPANARPDQLADRLASLISIISGEGAWVGAKPFAAIQR